jgi:hypothetical protein
VRGEAPGLVRELSDAAMFGIARTRCAVGHASDMGENDLREVFLPHGVVDVKVAARGDDWSGLKCVRHTEKRGM